MRFTLLDKLNLETLKNFSKFKKQLKFLNDKILLLDFSPLLTKTPLKFLLKVQFRNKNRE